MRWLIAIVLALGIVLTLILQGERTTPRPSADDAPPSTPDYWMEQAHIERFDANGQRHMEMEAQRMAHFPDDERTELDTVLAYQQGPAELRWTLQAREGLIPGDQSQVFLSGDVRLSREPPIGLITRIDTDSLLYLPESDRAETDDPIRMERGLSYTTGIGLIAEMAEDRLSILNEVRTRHVDTQE